MKRLTRTELILAAAFIVVAILVVVSVVYAFQPSSVAKDAQPHVTTPVKTAIYGTPADEPADVPVAAADNQTPADQADTTPSTAPAAGEATQAFSPAVQDDSGSEPAPQVYSQTAGGPVDPNSVSHEMDTSGQMNSNVQSVNVPMH